MTEHRRYADLAAMAIDYPLDAVDAEDLRRHLEGCVGCRRLADALRADAAGMRSIDFGPAPVVVRERVAALALAGPSSSPRLLLLVATGLLLLAAVFAGSAAVGAFLNQQRGVLDLSYADQITWQTEVVSLKAIDISIQAGAQRFSPVGRQVAVSSDPGKLDFRTLEATWQEHEREMRLWLTFGGDARNWWVDAIQTYDGSTEPKWAGVKGQFFRSPLNSTWVGNVDLELVPDRGGNPVRLHIERLQLDTTPQANVAKPNGQAPQPVKGNPFALGGALHCSGIFQMTPADAHEALLKQGYAVSWRLLTNGYSEVHDTPPDGVIVDGGLTGTSGEIIMFVVTPGDVDPMPPTNLDFSDCGNLKSSPEPNAS
jgi:hypothetical protein